MTPRQKASFSTRSIYLGLAGAIAIAAAGLTTDARAATFTDLASFTAAISGATSGSAVNFDAATAGDLIADGGSLDGITFSSPSVTGAGFSLEVRNDFNTTSPDNYLGTNDGGVLQDGDDLNLGFGASNAIGLFFITADVTQLIGDDVQLSAGGMTVGLDLAQAAVDLADGGFAYFLGIVDAGGSFSSASVTTSHDDLQNGNGFFLWNADDITLATVPAPIPLPATLPLFAAGLAGLWAYGRRRKKA